MNRATRLTAATVLAIASAAAVAGPMPSGRPTPPELTVLPDYCQARFGKDEAVRRKYAEALGKLHFLHIHHHCIGLNLLNRARFTLDRNTKRYYLQSAVGEFNYVLSRWPKEFPLTAEAENGKAMAATLLKSVPSRR